MRSVNFGPGQINNPYNALTLVSGLQAAFGDFSIALESTVSKLASSSKFFLAAVYVSKF